MPRVARSNVRRLLLLGIVVLPTAGCSLNGEKIVKVADLPDTPDYQIRVEHAYGPGSDLQHVDVGYVWQQDRLLGCPVVNENGRYVGYVGSDTDYVKLDDGALEQLAAKAGVTIPVRSPIPFWDAWGGRLALLSIPLLLTLSWVVDTRLRTNRAGVDEADAAPEFGAVIARYVKPARPTLMLLLGYGVPLALFVMGATSVVGLLQKHELGITLVVAVGFLVPMGIVFLFASAVTRGHGVVLYEGGIVRTAGGDRLKIRYEDLQRVGIAELRQTVSGVPVTRSYQVRFSPLYEHDFSFDFGTKAELDRLLAALAAKGVRIEAGL